jgi:hypothetical protein
MRPSRSTLGDSVIKSSRMRFSAYTGGQARAKLARQLMNESVNGGRQGAAVLTTLDLARGCVDHHRLDDSCKVPCRAIMRSDSRDRKGRVLLAALEILASVPCWGVLPIACRADTTVAALHLDEWQGLQRGRERATRFLGCPIAGFKIRPYNVRVQRCGCCRASCAEPLAGMDDFRMRR